MAAVGVIFDEINPFCTAGPFIDVQHRGAGGGRNGRTPRFGGGLVWGVGRG